MSGTSSNWEVEGRVRYSTYRRLYDIRRDWADLTEAERQEWRDDARREHEACSGG